MVSGLSLRISLLVSNCSDKFLARPGRKQANVSVRMAWISFGDLPCRKTNLMTAHVSMLLKSRASLTCFGACFLPGRAKDLPATRCVHLVRTQGLGIGIRSATDSFVLTHRTSVQATVHIGTNKVCHIVRVCSKRFAVRNWRQKGRAS